MSTNTLAIATPSLSAGLFTAWQRVSALFATSQPAPSRAQEAASVRDMAYQLQASDPGLAADLFAAADRHETLGA